MLWWEARKGKFYLTRTPNMHELRWDHLQFKFGYNPIVYFIVSTGLENTLEWGPTLSSFLHNLQGLKRCQYLMVTLSIIIDWFEWIKTQYVTPFLIFSGKLILALYLNVCVFCWNQLTVTRPPHTPETPPLHKPLSLVLPPHVQVEF